MRGKSKQQTFIKTPSLLQTPRPDTAPTCSLLRHASLHMPLSPLSMPLLSSLALALSSLSPLSLLSPSMPLSLTNLGKLLRHAGACGDKVPKCFKHVHGKFGGGGTGPAGGERGADGGCYRPRSRGPAASAGWPPARQAGVEF